MLAGVRECSLSKITSALRSAINAAPVRAEVTLKKSIRMSLSSAVMIISSVLWRGVVVGGACMTGVGVGVVRSLWGVGCGAADGECVIPLCCSPCECGPRGGLVYGCP